MTVIDLGKRRRLFAVIMIVVMTLGGAGCGRKGPPEPPPGAEYPRQYPSR